MTFVSIKEVLEFLDDVRANRDVNDSPYMDNALLNVRQIIQSHERNPFVFTTIDIGDCEDCEWRNRHQKCSCCRRNLYIKDCYEPKSNEEET